MKNDNTALLFILHKLQDEHGFNCYILSKEGDATSWAIVEHDGKFCCIQKAQFSGFDISTKHKPNRLTGTGFGAFDGIAAPQPHHFITACNMVAPSWVTGGQVKSVKKWNSIEEINKGGLRYKRLEKKTRQSVKVFFGGGGVITTEINGTIKDVQNYYNIGKEFNVGNVTDSMQRVTGLVILN